MAVGRVFRLFRRSSPPDRRRPPLIVEHPGPHRLASDRGQAVPLVAAAVALAAMVALGTARLGVVAADRARAHTAADAAALAGAVDGRSAAEEVARANGGTVVTFQRADGQVEVRVRVRAVEAVARARLVR